MKKRSVHITEVTWIMNGKTELTEVIGWAEQKSHL